MSSPVTPLTQAEAVRTLARAASPARRRLFLATLGMMLVGALAELATIGAVLPFLALVTNPAGAADFPILAGLFDRVGGGETGVILSAAGLLVVVAIVAGIARLVLTWLNLKFILLYGHDIGRQIFGRLLRQPYSDYVTRNSSVALASNEKLSIVIFGLLMPVMQGIAAAVISAFIVVSLLIIDPFAAIAAGCSLGLTYLFVSLAMRRRLANNSEILGSTSIDRIKVLQEGLGGLRDILIDNSQEIYEASFERLDYRYRSALVVNNMISLAPRYIVETSVIVMIAVFTVYFAGQAGGLIAAIPVLGAFAIGAQRLLPQIHVAYNGWTSYAGNRRLLIDVAELLTIPVLETGRRQVGSVVTPFEDKIRVENVTFRYSEREQALDRVDLTIAKGERIGFVGKTGSGKSTLIDLLMGLLLPSEGRITIDGVPLAPSNIQDWQAQIAHVPQSIYLSDGSITSNIAFGVAAEKVDLARVHDAARRADIHDFIVGQDHGYATTVGERGVRLSGGQRQRIGIARALYKGASVLVFDEATSALDEATEEAIMDSIYRLDRGVTLLMIAHRLSTLAECDRIVRLDGGQLMDDKDRSARRGEVARTRLPT